MSEFQPPCQNVTQGLFNRSWSGWHHRQVTDAAETIMLPSLIGIICSTGLVGNILIVFTIVRYKLYLTVTTFFFPLPLIFICYVLILCYTWEMYQQNKQAGSYTTSIPRQRIMRLTKMVLALVSVFVASTAPFHVIQLINLQVSQPTLTFYMSYYISICLSYASSSINPFFYILLSGNFQKRHRRCTNMEVRMADQDVNVIENTLKSFMEGFSLKEKCIIYV